MKSHHPSLVGFLQAGGILLYVALFVSLLTSTRDWTPPEPWMGAGMFLMAFVTSALICALLVFGHPVRLFLEGEKTRAVRVVIWTAGWLAALSGVMFLVARSFF